MASNFFFKLTVLIIYYFCHAVLSHSAVSCSLQTHALSPARFLSPWVFLGKNLTDSGMEPESPTLQADSLPSGSPGKSLGQEDSLEKGMATHSIILA